MNLILSNKYGKHEYIKTICRKSKHKNFVINKDFLSFLQEGMITVGLWKMVAKAKTGLQVNKSLAATSISFLAYIYKCRRLSFIYLLISPPKN